MTVERHCQAFEIKRLTLSLTPSFCIKDEGSRSRPSTKGHEESDEGHEGSKGMNMSF